MRYRFHTCDVFTATRFGGNPLAVLPHAAGLSDARMQQIAREFNYSESAFVFPALAGQTRRVRIFTPTAEVPFAGHPNIGTAFTLAAAGEFGEIGEMITVTFEERAGLVPITIRNTGDGSLWCELSAPQRLTLGRAVPVRLLAQALSLAESDILTTTHPPQVVSVGLPFLVAELGDRAALRRARPAMAGIEALVAEGVNPDIHLYVRSADEVDLRARMFAPLDGVPEDPATGSANCALAGLLAHRLEARDGLFRWRIAQGVEMGRPSLLEARAEKRDGLVVSTWIGGSCVPVSEGFITVDGAEGPPATEWIAPSP